MASDNAHLLAHSSGNPLGSDWLSWLSAWVEIMVPLSRASRLAGGAGNKSTSKLFAEYGGPVPFIVGLTSPFLAGSHQGWSLLLAAARTPSHAFRVAPPATAGQVPHTRHISETS